MSGGISAPPAPGAPAVIPEAWTREMGNMGGDSDFSDFDLSYTGVSLKDTENPHTGRMEPIRAPGPGPADPRVAPTKQSAKRAALDSQYETFLKNRDIGMTLGPGPGRR